MKPRRVLVLFDTDYEPPKDQDYSKQLATPEIEVEFEVAKTLMDRGHDVRLLGFKDDLGQLVIDLKSKPFDVCFYLVERFRDVTSLDYTVAGLLEMMNVPYTGTGPAGLILARHKALTKMVLRHHGIGTPNFVEIPRGEKTPRSFPLPFPLIVKPVDEDASVGIAHASVVHDAGALAERVNFVHERLKTSVIVEEFIAGREIYVGVVGNDPPTALPPIEMMFKPDVPAEQRIATFKVKWSTHYRENRGIENRIADDLPPDLSARIASAAVKTYQAAGVVDYGRIDMRVTHDGRIYVVEANPNPYLSDGEDMAWAAETGGYPYPELLEAIMEWAIARHRG